MSVQQGRTFIGRFHAGEDILASLTEFCQKENIRLGVLSLIGAVTSARMGYYDQNAQQYVDCVQLDKKLEVVSCTGNISLKEGDIFVHAHVVFADRDGRCYGGHLMPGTKIFAAEYVVQELTGISLERSRDASTGLSLWS